MRTIIFGAMLLLASQADNCGSAGGYQDRSVTEAKRAEDADRNLYQEQAPTPTPWPKPEATAPEWAK